MVKGTATNFGMGRTKTTLVSASFPASNRAVAPSPTESSHIKTGKICAHILRFRLNIVLVLVLLLGFVIFEEEENENENELRRAGYWMFAATSRARSCPVAIPPFGQQKLPLALRDALRLSSAPDFWPAAFRFT